MKVCGVDPSLTSAGIAGLRDGRPVLLRSIGDGDKIKSWHHRFGRITRQANAVTSLIRTRFGIPDLAVVEAPLTFGIEGTADSYDRYCLCAGICSWFDAQGVPYAVVHNQTRAKWATGKANGSSKELTSKQKKREVLDAVRATWRPWEKHIANDDIADALTLAEMGARHVGDPLHFPPRRRHIEALAGIAWPSILRAKPETTQAGAP